MKAARESKRVSNKDLCTALDMRPSQLSDIERGIASLALRRAWQISRHLGADFAQVIAAILQERLHEAGFTELRVSITSSENPSSQLAGVKLVREE